MLWDGSIERFEELVAWTGGTSSIASIEWRDGSVALWCGTAGAQGWVPVPVGHWIGRNGPHDLYPIDGEYFASHFTPHQEN